MFIANILHLLIWWGLDKLILWLHSRSIYFSMKTAYSLLLEVWSKIRFKLFGEQLSRELIIWKAFWKKNSFHRCFLPQLIDVIFVLYKYWLFVNKENLNFSTLKYFWLEINKIQPSEPMRQNLDQISLSGLQKI